VFRKFDWILCGEVQNRPHSSVNVARDDDDAMQGPTKARPPREHDPRYCAAALRFNTSTHQLILPQPWLSRHQFIDHCQSVTDKSRADLQHSTKAGPCNPTERHENQITQMVEKSGFILREGGISRRCMPTPLRWSSSPEPSRRSSLRRASSFGLCISRGMPEGSSRASARTHLVLNLCKFGVFCSIFPNDDHVGFRQTHPSTARLELPRRTSLHS